MNDLDKNVLFTTFWSLQTFSSTQNTYEKISRFERIAHLVDFSACSHVIELCANINKKTWNRLNVTTYAEDDAKLCQGWKIREEFVLQIFN